MAQTVKSRFYHNSALSRDETEKYQRYAGLRQWCAFSSWALHRMMGLSAFILFGLVLINY